MTDDDRQAPADGWEPVEDTDELNEQLSAPVEGDMAVNAGEVENVAVCGDTFGKNPVDGQSSGVDCGGCDDNE